MFIAIYIQMKGSLGRTGWKQSVAGLGLALTLVAAGPADRVQAAPAGGGPVAAAPGEAEQAEAEGDTDPAGPEEGPPGPLSLSGPPLGVSGTEPAGQELTELACAGPGPGGGCGVSLPSGPEVLRFASTVLGARPAPKGTVSQVQPQDMDSRGALTVAEALAGVNGVQLLSHPKSGSAPLIRGFDPRSSLVLLDGIPIREVYGGSYDLGSLAAAPLASIEVEKGIPTLLHGPGAMGGVVKLNSLSGDSARFTGRLGGYLGQYRDGSVAERGARLVAGRSFGPLQLSVAGSHAASEGFHLSGDYRPTRENAAFPDDGGRREGSDFARSQVHGKLSLAQGSWKLALVGDLFRQDRGIPPFQSAGYTRYWRYADYDTSVLGLSALYQASGPGTSVRLERVEAQAYLSLHEDTIEDYQDASYAKLTRNPLAWFVASSYSNATVGASLRPTLALGAGNELELAAGLLADRNRQRDLPVPRGGATETSWTPWEEYQAATGFLAVEDTQQLGRLRLVGGLGASGMRLLAEEIRGKSYAVDERVIGAWEGRLFADWDLGQRSRIVAAVGRKVRFPTLKELFSNALGGNAAIRPEEAAMSELGLELEGFPLAGARLALRGFYDRVTDMIQRDRDIYENIERATIAGVELEAAYRPRYWLSLLASYTWLRARNERWDRELDYRSPHVVELETRLRSRTGTSLAGQASWHDRQQGWYPDPLGRGWVEEKLPSFFLLHGRLQQDIALGSRASLWAYLQVHNLLDADHVEGSYSPQPGRDVQAGLGLDF